MKKIIGIMIVALLLTGCGSNASKGVSLLEEGKYEEAVEKFQADIEKEKNLDDAYRGMGIAYYEMGNYEEAVQYFEEALANETEETASIYHLMGTSCMLSEDYENTIVYYEKALKMEDCTDEMKQEMMRNKIVAYEKMLEWDSARNAAAEYLESYPDDEAVQKEAEFLKTR